jgi:hypothetical protein
MHRAIHKTRMVRSNGNQAQVERTSKIPNLLKVVVLGQRIESWAKLVNSSGTVRYSVSPANQIDLPPDLITHDAHSAVSLSSGDRMVPCLLGRQETWTEMASAPPSPFFSPVTICVFFSVTLASYHHSISVTALTPSSLSHRPISKATKKCERGKRAMSSLRLASEKWSGWLWLRKMASRAGKSAGLQAESAMRLGLMRPNFSSKTGSNKARKPDGNST